jgi:hypothetical protein
MRRNTVFVLSGLAVWGLVGGLTRISFPQSTGQDRIAGPIAGSPAVWLEGNRRPMFQPENDLGPAPDSLQLDNITLVFKPTAEQQANLLSLLKQQQDPSSPNYHHWLTPEQFADNFGMSASDVAQVVAWLQSQGFTITQTARSRLWVSFSGTAAQVRSALQMEIHHYSLHEKTYYANASEPAVPAVLADVVQGFTGLDNYRPKPHSKVRRVASETKPNFTSSVSENTFVAPGDFAVIYDVNALYNDGIDGTGQTIAVMGQTELYNNGSDITAFRSAAGLPAKSPTAVLATGSTNPGVSSDDVEEASLDVEWSGAVAKNATIIFVYSIDVFNYSLVYAIDQDIAPVISISYGACEADWGHASLNSLAQLAEEANSQGQTIVAAAGDSGAADCDSPTSPSSVVTIATHGLAVDAPASLPYVTGMGGSEFNEGSANYWQTATSSTGDILTSALSYIPEKVWNDTSSTNGLSAGGGGVSTFFTTKPTWQTGTGVPNDNARDVPDISLSASPAHDGYLICVQGSCVDGFRESIQGDLTVVGGTSCAAPTFAGIVALVNQQYPRTPPGQGNINQTLYTLAQNSPAALHDITTGNNIVPCKAGSPDCPASAPFQFGYSAGVGYDQASGLGSVDAYNLVMAWGSSTAGNLPAPSLTAPSNGATGVALSPAFSWTAVAGNAGYRIMIATTPADLPTNPATSTCSACTVVDTSTTDSYTPPSALAAGTYYWQVQAIEPSSSSGTAAWSSIFSFSTTAANLPAPTLSAPGNGATGVALPPAFSWTSVEGSAGYQILVATTQGALPTSPSLGTCGGGCTVGTTTTTASYTPSATALTTGTTYYWEVQALSSTSGVYGTWSSTSSFTTALPAPTLTAPANGATAVSLPPTLSWTAVTGNSGYSIVISTEQGALPTSPSVAVCGNCTISTTTTTASYTPSATALNAATTYYWEVQALSSSSGVYGTWSSASSFTTGASDFSLSASPNALTIAPGAGGSSTLTLTPINNFSATPTFTCSVASALAGVTCSVGTYSNNAATITITASSTAKTYPSLPRNPPLSAGWMASVAMLCLLLMAQRRLHRGSVPVLLGNLRVAALGAILAVLLTASLSCGGSGGGGGGGGGTTPPPAESGTVTVTSTSGNTTHTATISVSVS